MGSMRLYAIGIDEVRDIFRASPQSAASLREVAARAFGAPATVPAAGLLGKLGPVFRRQPEAPVLRPDVPSGSDIDALLCGRYVPPHRLVASWALLEAWLEHLAWATLTEEFTAHRLNEVDFALVRAEVPARLGLRNLLTGDLGTALLPCPGLAAGWAQFEHVGAMAAAWRAGVERLDTDDRPVAVRILAWLERYPDWADAAAAAGRPRPDLVAILRA